MDIRPIGMFDSGVGGLTVLKELIRENPSEDIVYLGDTKRFPYGSKSKESIIDLTKKGIEFLISKNVKAIVIACGTATSQALEEVKNEYDIPIIGIIDSTVEYIKENKDLRKIGVLATAGTIRSKGWESKIISKIPDAIIYNKACPLLAPMAEEGWINNDIAKLTIKEYLKDLKEIDCLILGCTHYPLIKDIIQSIVPNAKLLDGSLGVANEVKRQLTSNNLLNTKSTLGEIEIINSKDNALVDRSFEILDN